MRIQPSHLARGRQVAKGLRTLGTVAGKVNNSSLGTVLKVGAPRLGQISKAVEKYAPKAGNLIDKGLDTYEEVKGGGKMETDAPQAEEKPKMRPAVSAGSAVPTLRVVRGGFRR